MEKLLETVLDFLERNKIATIAALAGVVLILIGLLYPTFTQSKKEPVLVAPSAKETGQIAVDVEGAVVKPGVYKLPADSRVEDALKIAGGLAGTADKKRISAELNLAAKLIDGQKVYFYSLADQLLASPISQNKIININTASKEELDTLPGIGPVTAEKIISLRPYQKLEDLTSKKAVSKSVFDKIKDLVSVY